MLAVIMLFAITACSQSSSVSESTTSELVAGGITTTDGQTTSTTSTAVDGAPVTSGTVGGTATQGGWSSAENTHTAEEMDSLYPVRKNISGVVKVFTPFADDAYFKKAVDQMKKVYPGITKVDVISTSNVSRQEKLLSLINAGDAPDYVYTTYQDYPLRAAKGMTMPIDNYIYEHPGQSNALMNNNCSYNGKRYAVIIETPIQVLWYNTALFQRIGEKTPEDYYKEGNWTWSTLRSLAKKMTDSQNGIYGFATDTDYIFSLSMGADVIKFANGKASLNLKGNQTYMDGHQILIDMINVDKSTVPEHWVAHTEFAKGKVAMAFTDVNHDVIFDSAGMKTYDYTVFPRKDKNSDYYSLVGGFNGGFSIAKGSKNPTAGMAFGELLMNLVLEEKGNQTNHRKAYNLAKEANVKKIVSWFYGYGLESIYFQDFCGWARTGTKDLNTLIEENAPLMDSKLKEYQ